MPTAGTADARAKVGADARAKVGAILRRLILIGPLFHWCSKRSPTATDMGMCSNRRLPRLVIFIVFFLSFGKQPLPPPPPESWWRKLSVHRPAQHVSLPSTLYPPIHFILGRLSATTPAYTLISSVSNQSCRNLAIWGLACVAEQRYRCRVRQIPISLQPSASFSRECSLPFGRPPFHCHKLGTPRQIGISVGRGFIFNLG